jgi:uncharacterized protein YcbX
MNAAARDVERDGIKSRLRSEAPRHLRDGDRWIAVSHRCPGHVRILVNDGPPSIVFCHFRPFRRDRQSPSPEHATLMTPIGRVLELTRYPVKSMAGTPLQSAQLGLHGIDGDRRFGFRRIDDTSAFPFLTASRFPGLLTYQPRGDSEIPSHVRTPSGADLELRSEELRNEIAARSGHAVELMRFKNGIFDDGTISLIAASTIDAIGREVGMELDRRRMRANIVLETESTKALLEDDWVGATLMIGDAAVSITARDERCVMVNFDPDTGQQDARVMKTIVRMNDNYAGVYGAVTRAGAIHVGQIVHLVRPL